MHEDQNPRRSQGRTVFRHCTLINCKLSPDPYLHPHVIQRGVGHSCIGLVKGRVPPFLAKLVAAGDRDKERNKARLGISALGLLSAAVTPLLSRRRPCWQHHSDEPDTARLLSAQLSSQVINFSPSLPPPSNGRSSNSLVRPP